MYFESPKGLQDLVKAGAKPKPSMPVSTPETRNELQWQVDELRREVEELRKVVEELPSQMAEAVSDRLHGRLA